MDSFGVRAEVVGVQGWWEEDLRIVESCCEVEKGNRGLFCDGL